MKSEKDIQETFTIPSEAREHVNDLVENGVFTDIQSFTDTAINQFLCKFDHVKVNPSKATKSLCKFRTYAKTADRAINDLKRCGVQNYNIKLVDFCKIVRGRDFAMYHTKRGWLCKVFEIDIFEKNPNYSDGEEVLLF